jgi:hypothetical protein
MVDKKEIEQEVIQNLIEAEKYNPPAGAQSAARRALEWIADGKENEVILRASCRRQEGNRLSLGRRGLPISRSRGLGRLGWRRCCVMVF